MYHLLNRFVDSVVREEKVMHHNHNMIRQETPEDYQNVELLTREAFWNVYRPGCIEHYIVYRNWILLWKRTVLLSVISCM